MNANLKNLNEKIQNLTQEQLAEVENFVEFIHFRSQERELTRFAAAASTPTFEAIWNNSEDDVYDAL
jgi:hypothetical protein